ncbi:hypothetical protein LJC68_01610 [Bacteroidales bacterium OttesenSCG-928-B11]|nr:hypothetical protein [Bacteroidales bacterium OttesenSCG-928-E04]MDL2308171.1 hypothetical protein [Bacteroidales bacterium OttesenSCG-928-C03]MDL2311561.1 hypothetical protein [Bacteroidales bacterium OttesenSCG-928-B11]MDL2325610.1 hypothetical protein [Bacteroidales bacterium OttesenSCG-928-A14]
MTALLLLDNPTSIQEWKNSIRHFSACRKNIDVFQNHLFKILKTQKKNDKQVFLLHFIPNSTIFDQQIPSRSLIPTSYLLDVIRELLEMMLQNQIQINFVADIKTHKPINPFVDSECQIIINQKETEKESDKMTFFVEISKGKTHCFEACFNISL